MSIKLKLSHAQVLKAKRGLAIQLGADAIGHTQGHVFENLHPMTMKKLRDAKRLKKGARIVLSQEELVGAGFMDVIRKVGQFISKNKAVLKPIASAVLDAGATLYPAAAPVRQKVRELTGVGMGEVVMPIQLAPVVRKKVSTKKTNKKTTKKVLSGRGIIPAGYAGF
jgi:hypothetical protein